MAKLVSVTPTLSVESLAKVFAAVLGAYPEPLPAEAVYQDPSQAKEYMQELVASLRTFAEQLLALPDSASPEAVMQFVEKSADATKEQAETLARVWTFARERLVLASLTKKGAALDHEDRLVGVEWESRMATAGRNLQGMGLPLAMVQIKTKSVLFFCVIEAVGSCGSWRKDH